MTSPTDPRTTESVPAGSFGKGFAISALIAVVVAIGGGIFEAVTGWVTFTLMPDIVFLICNGIYLATIRKEKERKGAAVGFLNLLLVIVVSVITFMMAGGIDKVFRFGTNSRPLPVRGLNRDWREGKATSLDGV